MSDFQDWPIFWLGVVQTFLVVASLLLVRRQILHAVGEARLEHSRRCRESTIQFFSDNFLVFKNDYLKFEILVGNNVLLKRLTPELVDRIEADPELRSLMNRMLSFFESLSTGVNQGVFDVHLTDKLLGGTIIEAWKSFSPYIFHFRSLHKNDRFFDQFESLYDALQKIVDGKVSRLAASQVI